MNNMNSNPMMNNMMMNPMMNNMMMNPMMNMMNPMMNHPMAMYNPMMMANGNGMSAKDILKSVGLIKNDPMDMMNNQ